MHKKIPTYLYIKQLKIFDIAIESRVDWWYNSRVIDKAITSREYHGFQAFEKLIKEDIHMNSTAASTTTPIHTAEQTALDGFDPVPFNNEETSEADAARAARKRFHDAISQEEGMDTIRSFMASFGIVALLISCNILKMSVIGISASEMFAFLMSQCFSQFSIYRRSQMGTLPEGVSTSSVSRFLSNPKFLWETFLFKLGGKAVSYLQGLDSENEKCVFTGDDTDVNRVVRGRETQRKGKKKQYRKLTKSMKSSRRHRGTRTELVSRKYDHARKVRSTGFRMLTLGFADKLSFIPLGFVLLASKHHDKIIGDYAKEFKKNSAAYKRRELACGETLPALSALAVRALKFVKNVRHICVDRWFSNPSQIYELWKKTGLHVITVCKHNNTKYIFAGQEMTISQIHHYAKKHYAVNRHISAVIITVPGKGGKDDQVFQAKVVFVQNRANRKEWIGILTTDTSLSAEDIIEYYSLRWKTETYFWTAKMFLGLNSECHALSYDAITAHCTIVAARYIMLAIEKRKAEDDRTIGALFTMLEEEQNAADIGNILVEFAAAVFDAAESSLHLSKEQMDQFVDALMARLPDKIRKYLKYASNCKADEDEKEPPRKKPKKKSKEKAA